MITANHFRNSSRVAASDTPTAVILIDTPNIFRSVTRQFGLEARPDYQAFLSAVRTVSTVVHAEALVNDGLPARFKQHIEQSGYAVIPSHAMDVDEKFIARAVKFHARGDLFVLASGDGGYAPLVSLLRSLGRKVIVAAVPGSLSLTLASVADAVVEFPLTTAPSTSTGLIALRTAMLTTA